MGKCSKCDQIPSICSCNSNCEKNFCPYGDINTDCIIYNQLPNRSRLLCFLGVDHQTNLTTILEKLDSTLCLKPSSCAKLKFGLGCDVGINIAVTKLLDYVCELEDTKLKISSSDVSNGYLYNKIVVGDCINKIIRTDVGGVQTLAFELDFSCIKVKLDAL